MKRRQDIRNSVLFLILLLVAALAALTYPMKDRLARIQAHLEEVGTVLDEVEEVLEITPIPVPVSDASDPTAQQVALMYRIGDLLAVQIVAAVNQASQTYEVDPWLVLALIKVESDGNPLARSQAGALGLMQLLPATAESLAAELGEEWVGPEQLLEINLNVRYGVRYLRQLLDRFETPHAAIAAYNYGPTRIARRLRRDLRLPQVYPTKVFAALPAERREAPRDGEG